MVSRLVIHEVNRIGFKDYRVWHPAVGLFSSDLRSAPAQLIGTIASVEPAATRETFRVGVRLQISTILEVDDVTTFGARKKLAIRHVKRSCWDEGGLIGVVGAITVYLSLENARK